MLIDFRLVHSLLSAAGDPEVKMHQFAMWVRVRTWNKAPQMPTDSPQEEEVAHARAEGAAGGGREASGARRLELELLVGAAPPELRARGPSRSSQAVLSQREAEEALSGTWSWRVWAA